MQEEKLDWYTIMVRKLLTILKSQKEERLPEIPAQETIGTIEVSMRRVQENL